MVLWTLKRLVITPEFMPGEGVAGRGVDAMDVRVLLLVTILSGSSSWVEGKQYIVSMDL